MLAQTETEGRAMPQRSFQHILAHDPKPLVMPGVYDGLTTRLAEQAGFSSLFIGGFPVVGARYGVPDIGLRGLADIASTVADIVRITDLPVFVDIDDGYGDVKNAVNTLHTYERMGVAAVQIEDQVWPKRCGHIAGKDVVPMDFAVSRVRAVASERMHSDTIISARTDARTVNGLDDALRRADAFLAAGADWIFIEALETVEEIEKVGRIYRGVPLLANPLEGGRSPVLSPSELGQLGYDIIPYGISLILHATRTYKSVLADMKSGEMKLYGKGASFEEYKSAVGFGEWTRIETTYRP
jgi:2-methylisocitrate lyase-like PEP mutase family enzyme